MMAMNQKNPPTEEQLARMKAAQEIARKQQDLLNRELRTKYSNWHCALCGRPAMTQAVCRKAGGNVCMSHCHTCEYHQEMFGHCLYREQEKPWKTWATAETRKDLFLLLTLRTGRNCIIGNLDENCAYHVIDGDTGEISRGRIRFIDGAWHYGTFEDEEK